MSRSRSRLGLVIAVTLALGTALAAFVRKLLPFPRKITAQHKGPGETLVTFFGDSITEGLMSASFVDVLAGRLGRDGYRFMNAGVGGDTTYNLLERLDPVTESHPDVVVILVGTNDLQAYLRGGFLPPLNQALKKLPQAMTPEWYTGNLRGIVTRLQQATPARIALCSIPPLGEDLDAEANESVQLFNQAVRAIAAELGAVYLPVYEQMDAWLRAQPSRPRQPFDQSRVGGLILRAAWMHNILGHRWDDVSARTGLTLQTDSIHFNDQGAKLIADVIEPWLRTPDAPQP
ncbi:SGNH/GDSL hydrolase family protein [Deinococcus alpinitundrae]|uniref:SGNH/GDSL hydrolase family protein n=1 Tax=Deinococcus alpinitundrae TaxID=468913 RepID=UPI00137B01F2|nr:SGNH/GDSL hydrolase family protein [Deinococcus alpinitundrae]